ncbi:TetR/AcrR family transcriptional regulator [uncultured Methanobrevibacter sp.]|uniref:TetR/AcrR family transcriptional regulator n=1 Tax=uncultured Methanobrevibacter sp. TaxID=253161 RepID=UPI0025F4A8E3|nr:TetR/AcrR family transcriptional regulator [uncultured Methanobrevibacter sp.]
MQSEFDSTEKKIIKATFIILQKEGFDKTTTKKIASEAGVNEVTIFRKFDTKKNLIEITKNYYFNEFLEKIESIFEFTGDETIEEYLGKNFEGLFKLKDQDFSIIKISMQEVSEIPEKKRLISVITNTMLNKLDEFFKLQIEKGEIRNVDTRVLSITCFSVTFQSIVLRKIYSENTEIDSQKYADAFLDILYNGIKE